MTETIIFDERCVGWSKHPELIETFLRIQENALKVRFSNRGYLYSDRICEYYGAPWDPREQINNCYLVENGELVFEYGTFPDFTMITIRQVQNGEGI